MWVVNVLLWFMFGTPTYDVLKDAGATCYGWYDINQTNQPPDESTRPVCFYDPGAK